jgi:hypothetical protein
MRMPETEISGGTGRSTPTSRRSPARTRVGVGLAVVAAIVLATQLGTYRRIHQAPAHPDSAAAAARDEAWFYGVSPVPAGQTTAVGPVAAGIGYP